MKYIDFRPGKSVKSRSGTRTYTVAEVTRKGWLRTERITVARVSNSPGWFEVETYEPLPARDNELIWRAHFEHFRKRTRSELCDEAG